MANETSLKEWGKKLLELNDLEPLQTPRIVNFQTTEPTAATYVVQRVQPMWCGKCNEECSHRPCSCYVKYSLEWQRSHKKTTLLQKIRQFLSGNEG